MSRMEALHSEMTAPPSWPRVLLHWWFSVWFHSNSPWMVGYVGASNHIPDAFDSAGLGHTWHRVRCSLSHPTHRSPLDGTSEFPGQDCSALTGY